MPATELHLDIDRAASDDWPVLNRRPVQNTAKYGHTQSHVMARDVTTNFTLDWPVSEWFFFVLATTSQAKILRVCRSVLFETEKLYVETPARLAGRISKTFTIQAV